METCYLWCEVLLYSKIFFFIKLNNRGYYIQQKALLLYLDMHVCIQAIESRTQSGFRVILSGCPMIRHRSPRPLSASNMTEHPLFLSTPQITVHGSPDTSGYTKVTSHRKISWKSAKSKLMVWLDLINIFYFRIINTIKGHMSIKWTILQYNFPQIMSS